MKWFMPRLTGLLLLLLSQLACKPPEESRMKAVVGAVLIDGDGGPPLSDSVLVVSGDSIGFTGPRTSIPIPATADKIDGSGKYIVPAMIDIYPHAAPLLSFATPDEARAKIAELASRKAASIDVGPLTEPVADAALEAAREAGIRVIAHVSTEAQVRIMVKDGAAALVGMIQDTVDLDPALITRLRDLRIAYAPALTAAGPALETAKRNTRRLFDGGVMLAVASSGDFPREIQLIVDAGVPPLDAIVAATRNGAFALGQQDRVGVLREGMRADLLVLSSNPGEDIRNLTHVSRRMSGGEWAR
jgi:imidazolonepropionase-like amidohydrolase